MANINDSYFDGHYKNIWKNLIPEGLTKAEVEFFIQEANLKSGDKVLDLMCGYGRHTLALARQEIVLTAVDNLSQYIDEIKGIAFKESLPVTVIREDIIQFQPNTTYNLVICMGNSLSFFNQEESTKLFSMITSCLSAGSKFIFNSWMIAETALKQFVEKAWSYSGQIKFLSDSKFLLFPSRIETESFFISPDGTVEEKKGVDYIYSLNEIEAMLKQSGLIIKEIWSIPGKKKFALGEPRVYVIAEKL